MKPLSCVKFIVVHCADTKSGQNVTKRDLHNWHVVERGWSAIGYHYFIKFNGSLHECREDHLQGAHCKAVNDCSLAICLEGGYKGENNFTRSQKKMLRAILDHLKKQHPNAAIVGHNHFDDKACPSFDVVAWYDSKADRSLFPFLLK